MIKKIIGTIIIGIIITSSFGSLAIAKNNLFEAVEETGVQYNIPKSYEPNIYLDNETQVKTMGPIAPMLGVAEILIIKGPFIKTFIIRFILSSLRAYFLLPNISINVKDMTFLINYKRNVPNIPFFNRFSYNTTVNENGNEDSYNKKHILVVSGFDGTFGFSRMKFSTLTPAKFRFDGTCDNLIVAG